MLSKRFFFFLPVANAHCDTAEGPAVIDGRRTLDSGEIGYALKWIPASDEPELKRLFNKVMDVRRLSPEAAEVADRLFLETLVRLHRLAEGVGFTGIKPLGAHVAPVVLEADRAMESGDLSVVLQLTPTHRHEELIRRFDHARSKREFDVADVASGRDYISAYVSFFKFAEGEEHDQGHHPQSHHADLRHEASAHH